MAPTSPTGYKPVSPVDMTSNSHRSIGSTLPQPTDEKAPTMLTRSLRSNSADSKASSLSGPRRARFVEATTVDSPVVERGEHRLPWSKKKKDEDKVTRPSDVGFGYISDNNPVEQHATLRPDTANVGLKSAMKTPGTAGRLLNPLSPTFRQEQMLEKEEDKTEKQQAQDLVSA